MKVTIWPINYKFPIVNEPRNPVVIMILRLLLLLLFFAIGKLHLNRKKVEIVEFTSVY